MADDDSDTTESTADELTDVTGVGASTAMDMAEMGIGSIEDLATADTEAIAESVDGVGETRAETLVANAAELVPDGDEDDVVDTTREDDLQVTPVPLPDDGQLQLHLTHMVLEEATVRHGTQSFRLRDEAYSVARKLMAAEYMDADVIDLTEEELTSLYRALDVGTESYARRPGITQMWEEFQNIKDDVAELR